MTRVEIDIETLSHKEGVGGETRVSTKLLADISKPNGSVEEEAKFASVELGFAHKILGILKMAMTMTGAAAPVGTDGKPLWNPNGVLRDTDGKPVSEARPKE